MGSPNPLSVLPSGSNIGPETVEIIGIRIVIYLGVIKLILESYGSYNWMIWQGAVGFEMKWNRFIANCSEELC